jgi:D-aminopeptidase
MERYRARDLGVVIGTRPTGPRNAITDVAGVRVGHATLVRDPNSDGRGAVRTGVTAIFPHDGLPWLERVYAATHILNGFGELIGINQIGEWGLLHSPIVMTSSLAIGRAYDATVRWRTERHATTTHTGGDMPVVTECDDSFLNDVTAFPLADEDVFVALDAAAEGDVAEGCVGAGTGMQCMDFKGGIGTASRVGDRFTVGVLVLTNFGERELLRIDGVPVGREIPDLLPEEHREGSCIVITATDAPLLPHQLRRIALRSSLGLARCGSTGHNGSGELMLAFSTANRVPLEAEGGVLDVRAVLDGGAWQGPSPLNDLFAATVEAVEEAVLNALFTATTTVGRDGNVLHAIPIDRTLEILGRYGRPARRL